jgi:hypothetical protein
MHRGKSRGLDPGFLIESIDGTARAVPGRGRRPHTLNEAPWAIAAIRAGC